MKYFFVPLRKEIRFFCWDYPECFFLGTSELSDCDSHGQKESEFSPDEVSVDAQSFYIFREKEKTSIGIMFTPLSFPARKLVGMRRQQAREETIT